MGPSAVELLLRWICRAVNPYFDRSPWPIVILHNLYRIQLYSKETEHCFTEGITTIAEQPALHPAGQLSLMAQRPSNPSSSASTLLKGPQ